MKIKLGAVEIELSDLRKAVLLFRGLFERSQSPAAILDCVDPKKLLVSLGNAIEFLLKDRLEEGIGKGGWGRSDRIYMSDLYGPEEGVVTRDSVMTTVSVIVALQAADKLLRRFSSAFAVHTWPQIWDEIRSGVNTYTKERWDSATGAAGTLRSDRDGTPRLAPSYRHTAWFLRLVTTDCAFVDAARIAQHLIKVFDGVEWEKEKASTPAASLSAFELIERDEGLLGLVNKAGVTYRRQVSEQVLVKKYMANLDPDQAYCES